MRSPLKYDKEGQEYMDCRETEERYEFSVPFEMKVGLVEEVWPISKSLKGYCYARRCPKVFYANNFYSAEYLVGKCYTIYFRRGYYGYIWKDLKREGYV